MDEFPELFMIVAERTYQGMFHWADGAQSSISDSAWLESTIQVGPLGSVYPSCGWEHEKRGVKEGDTPTFLHLLSGTYGLNDPEQPWYGGWGGRFIRTDSSSNHWIDAPEGPHSITRFQQAFQHDFAARMAATINSPSQVNHRPVVVVNGDDSNQILSKLAQSGENVTLDASGTYDPDGDALTHTWWHYHEASTASTRVSLRSRDMECQIAIPQDATDGSIHLILEVTDDGAPPLTSYRRVVLTVEDSSRS